MIFSPDNGALSSCLPPGTEPGGPLTTQLVPLTLAHPLINASGTFDLLEAAEVLGQEFVARPPVAAYVPKTVTLHARRGNEPPRLVETASGLMNSIGLPNQGVEEFCRHDLPRLLGLPCPLIVNVAGFTPEEYVLAVERLRWALDEALGVYGSACAASSPSAAPYVAGRDEAARPKPAWAWRVGLEVNISCPNVHSGCMSIGTDPDETFALLRALREVWPEPALLVAKLTPNVTDIQAVAEAAERGGAGALALVNTFKGLVLDPVSLRPLLGGVTGGLSGPAIKPLALRAVFEVRQRVGIPLIGIGGVETVVDVVDFLAAGASVVAVGAAGFRDPCLPARLAGELGEQLRRRSLSLAELIGVAHAAG